MQNWLCFYTEKEIKETIPFKKNTAKYKMLRNKFNL